MCADSQEVVDSSARRDVDVRQGTKTSDFAEPDPPTAPVQELKTLSSPEGALRAERHTEMRRIEGGLLYLQKVVHGIPIKNDLSKFSQREVSMRPDFR